MSYWDTSALVKLYVKETDSILFETHAANSRGPIVTSRLTLYEAVASFRRKEAEGRLATGATSALREKIIKDVATAKICLMEISQDVEREYSRLLETCYSMKPPCLIRTGDGIQLASARVAKEAEVVVTDKRMREAAAALGFSLFPK